MFSASTKTALKDFKDMQTYRTGKGLLTLMALPICNPVTHRYLNFPDLFKSTASKKEIAKEMGRTALGLGGVSCFIGFLYEAFLQFFFYFDYCVENNPSAFNSTYCEGIDFTGTLNITRLEEFQDFVPPIINYSEFNTLFGTGKTTFITIMMLLASIATFESFSQYGNGLSEKFKRIYNILGQFMHFMTGLMFVMETAGPVTTPLTQNNRIANPNSVQGDMPEDEHPIIIRDSLGNII